MMKFASLQHAGCAAGVGEGARWSVTGHGQRLLRRLASLFALMLLLVAQWGWTSAQAQTNNLRLNVVSARAEPRAFGGAGVAKGAAITRYKYLISVDNTGRTTQRSPDPGTGCHPQDAGYPNSCLWTSIAGVPGSSPIYTQGTEVDFATAMTLPNGRYLISVIADGYKLDGKHFTIPLATNTPLTVELQPFPLPDATLRALVFEDISPTNGAPDQPAERGLAGFQGQINDYLGQVTTDVYGNPLCTRYVGENPTTFEIPRSALDANMRPVVAVLGGKCFSDANGILSIPHLGPARYTVTVTPPDGTNWVQTTTLEGNHDFDAWVMEGATGYDTEVVVGAEPVPPIIFGFVKPATPNLGGRGSIKGVVAAYKVYVPPKGGVVGAGEPAGLGARVDRPISKPWLALTDLGNGDTAIWVGQGDANGAFTIPNVKDGNYTLTWWDEPQNYILNLMNVTVANGEVVDLGILPLTGWWTRIEGYVFNDINRNGIKDPGEPGLPGYTLTFRKRENSLMDRGAAVIRTDANGYYVAENAYPMTQWLVLEAYDDAHYTTGVTYQADNQPSPTTVLGSGVDVSVLPIIGLGGRIDWGKHTYDAAGTNGIDPRNGGIVGTVTYDTTRNELDPRYAAAEDWQPGISGLTMTLHAPVPCGTTQSTRCTNPPGQRYELDIDGALTKGRLLNTYVTEKWERPTSGCVARGVDNQPLTYPNDQQISTKDSDCLEAPLMGVQFATYAADGNFGATVDGNYGFGDGCVGVGVGAYDPVSGKCGGPNGTDPTPLPAGDYLVSVQIPKDARGKDMYKVTREEDVNIGNGDQFVPQALPPACAGPLHTVDVAGQGTDRYPSITLPNGVIVPASTPVDNPTFPGVSVYEGLQRPLCTTKLVPLANGKSIVPVFHLHTDVPLPARMWGLIVDDLNISPNPKSTNYGEKAGVPFAPVGIYDWTNRLITTVESDYNGLWDVLLPSTNRINCPTPSGVCANVYRFVGNDPGIPGRLNLNYKPEFRTIAAEFETLPGLLIPADLAPTQVGVIAQPPGSRFTQVMCMVNDPANDPVTPELFAVSRPYANVSNNQSSSFTINGQGFGATKGTGAVTLTNADGDVTTLTTTAWSDTQITATVPGNLAGGPRQLKIRADNGRSTINGLTFHVLRSNGNPDQRYNPTVREVGPGRTHATIQAAINAANSGSGNDLVVVYPGNPDLVNPRANPRGAYYENLIISAPLKLQGVGPGGIQQKSNTTIPGSIIDGSAFGGDTALATAWRTRVAALDWVGNPTLGEGAVITFLARSTSQYGSNNSPYTTSFSAAVDGFSIRGGDQQGAANTTVQGGAIYAHAYIRNLEITNNEIVANSSSYGAVRIGTPNMPAPTTSQQNQNVQIVANRIIRNAGTNLAGGLALFAGADNYEVAGNDICGNFSAEYGGGMTHYGLSPNGNIHHNRIYHNQSYDEGGGIMIAGQLPANPATLSPGAGAVNIFANLIQGNMSNDDGGGLRFLQAGNFPMNVYNNIIVNNVSTHEGGGVALNDAPNVRFYNNTVMKNLTTATAMTSDGLPAPAGLSTSRNSAILQATLPSGSPVFSNPLLFNNIFWDNRAGARSLGTVVGLGRPGDATPINYWDLGVADGSGQLSPTNSIIQQNAGARPYVTSPTNVSADPVVVDSYDVSVSFQAWRTNPSFVGSVIVTNDLPPQLLGNYHLSACPGSPACNVGAASKAIPSYQRVGNAATLNAPSVDFDNDTRPRGAGFEIGADEIAGTTVTADLAVTITDGQTSMSPGGTATYTIVVTNNGPNTVTGATLTDTFPSVLTVGSWSCVASAGSVCAATGAGNNRAGSLTLVSGGTATFTAATTLSTTASGNVVNTVSVAVPGGVVDPNTANNSATDTNTVILPLPNLPSLDTFNRANAATLGTNWSQTTATLTVIRLNSNQASCAVLSNCAAGTAIWNGTSPVFGARQGAAFTFSSATAPGAAYLVLKASGTSGSAPTSYIRVRYLPLTGQVVVDTTTNSGGSFTSQGTFTASFGNGDRLTAAANADGSVSVWKTSATNVTTFLGTSSPVTAFTGGGRIGMQMLATGQVDNFSGGTLP